MNDTFRSTKMTDQIVLQLTRDIVVGKLEQGAPAPTEADLVAQFGISKAAAREIFRVLSALGLVRVQQGKRSVVCYETEWQILTPVVQEALRLEWGPRKILDQLFEARIILEPAATALAAQRATPDALEQMESYVDAMSRSADISGDIEELMEADRRFHDAIAQVVGNDVLRAMMRDLHMLMVENWAGSMVSTDDLPMVVKQHRAILEALKKGSPDEAEQAMRVHVLTARDMEVGRR